jgi:hypothetical protein
MCGARLNDPGSSAGTAISNLARATPISDVQPNPPMSGFIGAGFAGGVYSPCEVASTSEQRLSGMNDAEEREREEWARQTQERLEQIVEAYKPKWASDAPNSGSLVCLTVPVSEVANESQHHVEERKRPYSNGKEEDVAAQLGAEVSRRFDERLDRSDESLRAQLEVSGPSLMGLGANHPQYSHEQGEIHSHRWRYVLLLIFLVLAVLVVMEWRVSSKDESTNLMNELHLAPTISSVKPADAKEKTSPGDPPALAGTRPAIPSPNKSAASIPTNTSVMTAKHQPAKENPSNAIMPSTGADASLTAGSFELLEGVQAGATAEGRTWLLRAMSKGNGVAPVLLADMYAQGNGVAKDCEQAVLLLKTASKNANPHARSQLGSMYATGQCVPRDRVEAYRWMHSALQVDPGRERLKRNQETLWKEMDAGERQRASDSR